jgi:hypothetical protein
MHKTIGKLAWTKYKTRNYNIIKVYHPNIRSDTWPNMPFPGDCPTGSPLGSPTAVGVVSGTTAFCTCIGDCPGFRNAEVDGASLIGVPYVGVLACVWAGEISSTAIEFGNIGEPPASGLDILESSPRPAD